MARTESSHPARERIVYKLRDIHRRAESERWPFSRLTTERGSALNSPDREKLTQYDAGYVFGVAGQLWESSARMLKWRLGFETGPVADHFAEVVACSDGKHPTHGGFFWPTGEVAMGWGPLA